MTLANPAGLALLLLAVPVILLHVLRPRRQPRHVSSTFLWRELAQPVAASRPWQRLRPTVLLALQLLAVVLLAVAVAQPVRRTSVALAAHTVFLVDASGSMASIDGDPDRLAQAKEQADALRDQLPGGGVASIVAVGDRPEVLLTASADRQAFDDALARVHTTGGGADFAGAFALAASLETPGTPIGFALFSDGGLSDEGKRLLPPGTEYQVVGRDATNRALSRLTVEPRGSGLHARVNVRNTGGPAATQTVRFDVDGKTATTNEVALGEGEAKDLEIDLPAGERVEVLLEGEDLLGADDHLYAVAGHRRTLKVLVAGPEDPFLDAVLAATPDVQADHVEQPAPTAGYDLAIYDRVAVPTEPTVPFLAIAPPGGAPGVDVTGTVETPSVALVRADDPLLQDVDLSGIAIAEAQRIDAPKGITLVGAEGTPLLVRGSDPAHPYAYLGFALGDSNLPVNIAFPIIVDRLLVQLAGASLPPSDLTVGQALPVDPGVAVTVVNPDGREVAVAPGGAAPVATMPGYWVLRSPAAADGSGVARPERVVAVNVASAESDLRPQPDLPIPVRPASEADQTSSGQRPVLVWLIVPLLAVLLAEYLVARRRVGVAPAQWRGAVALRAFIALLLVAALLGLSFSRPADRVATIFLIDVSDSVGGPSRAESIAWVREALAHQPEDAVGGVALFGGDARLELTVDEQRELGQPAVKIDATRTNLATALRLAAAVLPEDARRRVVLVSDGRATEGETEAEADRLAEAGIQVDVHAVGTSRGADVAVSSLDGPGVAHVGDQVELTAIIESTVAGPAVATLDLDGKVLGEQPVQLEEGTNRVAFRVPAAAEGIDRYRVRVSSTDDTVVENNVGYAAVRVEGEQRVLVAEGVTGSSETLVAALRSTNLAVDVVPASSLPALDELSRYTSTVLVDVDVHDLSTEQTQTLAAATRDLGKGLVTIGGDRSYGLGGYRESDLEQLLPVISEISDPKRKQSVAEVLAIDTSGSMSACHCAEGGFNGMPSGNMVEGGVRKTDIARAGAARAVDALDAQDEIGLLAVTNRDDWVIDLQQVPSDDVMREGLDKIQPGGGTDLSTGLMTAAAKLRESKASLKHIILFTDGFTSLGNLDALVAQAKELSDSGITVSVLGTGEGSAAQLEAVAKAGRGRFYPGHDMQNIPQIMQQEVQIAARSFINEGTWYPEIASAQDPVRDLASSPPLLGYVATTAKPTATTLLRLGDEHDPLLATWQAGLGKVTSWTSDASARWSKQWASWDGYAAFWSGVVRSTAPAGSTDGSVRARIVDGKLEVTLESAEPFPDGAAATARVTGPDLRGVDVPLVRTGPTTFVGDAAATQPGSYAIGASVTGPQGAVLSVTTLASVSYSPEYRPGEVDTGTLALVSARTHGRGEIVATAAFDAEPLSPGTARILLAGLLLLLAALLWPVAVALSRLALTGTPAKAVGSVGRRARGGLTWLRAHLPSRPGAERGDRARPARTPTRDLELEPPPMIDPDARPTRADRKEAGKAPTPTVSRLLEAKRGGGTKGDDPSDPPSG